MERTPNSDQQRVIDELENNLILYASAGTGKTFTVAQKVKKIIESGLAAPEEILCLTFTIKACEEMQEDILSGCESARGVEVRTIHSFCHQVVKAEAKRAGNGYVEPVVCDEVDQEEILSALVPERVALWEMNKARALPNSPEAARVTVCPECKSRRSAQETFCEVCGFDLRTYVMPKKFTEKAELRALVTELKHARVLHGSPTADEQKDYARAFARNFEALKKKLKNAVPFIGDAELAGEIVHEYNAILRRSNRMDFDDLILEARAFLLDPEVCARWQKKYKFIVVDEMQDTSALEYDVLSRLFPGARVMLCGDLFQTIYEWRGSRPREVLDDFIRRFHAKVYMLSENYRATALLSSASFGYLKNTYPEEVGAFCPKELVIASRTAGEPIRFVECRHPEDHAMAEARFLFLYLRRHPVDDPTKICVMARSNKYIAKIWKYFNRFNEALPENERLQFFTAAQDYRFFKTPIVKDALALLSLLVNPTDEVAMERLAEKYINRVGPATMAAIRAQNGTGLSLTSFLERDTYERGDPLRTLTDAVAQGNVVVYDTETTGLDLSRDGIIQIAAMRMDAGGNPISKLMRFVIPTAEISRGALETHGYSLDYIKANGGVTASEALKEFSDFVRGAVLVGHNSVKFDRAVVDRQLFECGLPPLDIKEEYDTLALAKLLLPALKNHKLATLCEHFGIVNERAHDAFADVDATAKVLSRMTQTILAPAAAEREKVVQRYKNVFRPFYERVERMRGFLQADDSDGLCGYITDALFERYERDWERDSLRVLFLLARDKREESPTLEAALRELLAEAALAGSEMDLLIRKLKKIPIITVHQSKGCEFDTVLLAGVDNFLFPIAREGESEEEDKRVFYVAISRAKERLVMTCHTNNSMLHPRGPSRYVYKIPQEYIEWFSFDGFTAKRR